VRRPVDHTYIQPTTDLGNTSISTNTPPSFSSSGWHDVHLSPWRTHSSHRPTSFLWGGCYCRNFDSLVYDNGSGRASIGSVIHDSRSRVILSFIEKTEHSTVAIVEARVLACSLCLGSAWTGSWWKAMTLYWCTYSVSRRHGREDPRRDGGDRHAPPLLCGLDVGHVYHESNSVGHTLCRQAYEYVGVWHALVLLVVWDKAEEDHRVTVH
jgi:hypothetical protein